MCLHVERVLPPRNEEETLVSIPRGCSIDPPSGTRMLSSKGLAAVINLVGSATETLNVSFIGTDDFSVGSHADDLRRHQSRIWATACQNEASLTS